MLFKLNIRQSMLNAGMMLSVVTSCIILFRSLYIYGLYQKVDMDILTISIIPLSMSGYIPFACVFSVLPYSMSFLEEKNSGYLKLILTRMKSTTYSRNKVFYTALSGGVAICIPFALIFLYAAVIGRKVTTEFYPQVYVDHIWGEYMFLWNGWFVVLGRMILFFMFGCIWALIALIISCICPNRYVTFLAPFIIYQILWMTFQGKYTTFLNPVILFRADFPKDYSIYTPFLIQGVICIFLIVLAYRTVQCALKK